jgi:hypothetical protein
MQVDPTLLGGSPTWVRLQVRTDGPSYLPQLTWPNLNLLSTPDKVQVDNAKGPPFTVWEDDHVRSVPVEEWLPS